MRRIILCLHFKIKSTKIITNIAVIAKCKKINNITKFFIKMTGIWEDKLIIKRDLISNKP